MTAEHDGNAFLGIAIGLAIVATLIGFLWVVLGSTFWQVAGLILVALAAVVFVRIVDKDIS